MMTKEGSTNILILEAPGPHCSPEKHAGAMLWSFKQVGKLLLSPHDKSVTFQES